MPNDNTQNVKQRMLADFDALKSDLGVAAESFYRHLFALNSDLRKQFANVEMDSQGQMLFQAMGMVIGGLDNFDELRPVLENLGYRHAGYGVLPEH